MARICPDGWQTLDSTGAARREIETLTRLARGLPDDYTVYHGVHWTTVEQGTSIFGEIDFVVVNADGDLLLIEQKSGFLEETADGLAHKFADKLRHVPLQLARSVNALRSKLTKLPDCAHVSIDYLLYCPDYTVKQPTTAGIAVERIVDAERRDRLIAAIIEALPPHARQPASPIALRNAHRFLRDLMQLEADVNAQIGQARTLVTRIAGGLAHWARQLEFAPRRLRVVGTAGSGKTQLALAEYAAALDAGKRPLYVCFNRPLADHFAAIVPPNPSSAVRGLACTFHALCEQVLRAHGETPDFRAPNAFTVLIERARALPIPDSLRFDTVIVDEGQDFIPAWRDQVLRHAQCATATDARLLWLEDPLQNLYGNTPVDLPGWVTLRSQTNYRSPRDVVAMLQKLVPDGQTVEARAPLASAAIEILDYADDAGLLTQTRKGIQLCLAARFRRQDIAVISFRGREHSQLLTLAQLGPYALRSFTGRYDMFGNPEYSEGEVLVESVYRFKGQAAPAVVLTEIDFDALDERARRKLFVGATRAMLKLVLVVSPRAHDSLAL